MTIGDDVVIGAYSVVTRDIKSNSVAVGTPVRIIKTTASYETKIRQQFEKTKRMSLAKKKSFYLKKFGK